MEKQTSKSPGFPSPIPGPGARGVKCGVWVSSQTLKNSIGEACAPQGAAPWPLWGGRAEPSRTARGRISRESSLGIFNSPGVSSGSRKIFNSPGVSSGSRKIFNSPGVSSRVSKSPVDTPRPFSGLRPGGHLPPFWLTPRRARGLSEMPAEALKSASAL